MTDTQKDKVNTIAISCMHVRVNKGSTNISACQH